jgi:hypothetical protein
MVLCKIRGVWCIELLDWNLEKVALGSTLLGYILEKENLTVNDICIMACTDREKQFARKHNIELF